MFYIYKVVISVYLFIWISDHNSHSRVGQFFWGKIVKIVIAAKTGKMA